MRAQDASSTKSDSTVESRPAVVALRTLPSAPCFSSARFVSRVQSRVAQVRLVEGDSDASVEVQVRASGKEYSAELKLHLEDGSVLTRNIAAPTCEEASEAIAFVASVALDEDQGDRSVKKLPSPEPVTKNEPSSVRSYRGQLGLGVSGLVGATPKLAVGPSGSFFYGQVEGGWWSPAVAVFVHDLFSKRTETTEGTARFDLLEGRLDLCPSQLRLGIVSIRPCGLVTAGRLRARGSETDAPKTQNRFYSSGGAELLLDLEVESRMHLTTRGFAAFPLIRDQFQFADVVFHQTQVITYGFGAGVEVQVF